MTSTIYDEYPAKPFTFSNAKGNIKTVDSLEEIQRIAFESASNFRKAILAWRQFIDDVQPRQTGYNCAIFRNEGGG